MVSLNLRAHRLRFKTYQYSFTTEEAVHNLANLKFAQSNRMPDPSDPSRVVTTTTTTTFSMAKDMARALCQRFIDARLFESANDKSIDAFKDKTVWALTPKGVCKLGRFVQKNGISAEHVSKLLSSKLNSMQLVTLERDLETDEILQDKSIVEIVFRRFVGRIPNVKSSTSAADSETVAEYADGMIGVKLADQRKLGDTTVRQSFTGKVAIAWISECTTVLDLDEAHEVAEAFIAFGLISFVGDNKQRDADDGFQMSKNSVYIVTPKGRRVAGWTPLPGSDIEKKSFSSAVSNRVWSPSTASTKPGSIAGNSSGESPKLHDTQASSTRETNTNRLVLILNDPGLRSQFREFLRENYCEENLSFYLDVVEFVRQINNVQASDDVSEGLAKAYSIYNAYLAAGSPCELNLDHQLRLEMAGQMTKAVHSDEASMFESLNKVAELYDRAQKQVFRLMAGDSVPKFMKTPLYLEIIGDYDDPNKASLPSPP